MLMFPEKNLVVFMGNNFLNYWQDDGAISYRGKGSTNRMRQRKDIEKVQFYILARAESFFHALAQDYAMLVQHIDAAHFLTESLLQLWRCIDNNKATAKRPSELIDRYVNSEQLLAYENFLKGSVFTHVKLNYTNLKTIYQVTDNKKLDSILSVQNYQATHFVNTYIPFESLNNSLSNMSDSVREEYRFLLSWLKERKKLSALKHIPLLVHFYNIIHKLFAYRISEEESLKMTVKEAIESLRKFEEKSVVAVVEKLFEEVKSAWTVISYAMVELEGCRDMMENRRFEGYILDLNDNTIFASLLTHSESDAHDEIMRMVDGLLQKQNDILSLREHNTDWNKNQLLFEENTDELSLDSLIYDNDKQHMLLIGDVIPREFEHFVLSHMSTDNQLSRPSLSFDLFRIQRHILEKTSGKLSWMKQTRQPFRFLSTGDVIEVKSATAKQQLNESEEKSIKPFIGIRPLLRYAEKIKEGKTFGQPIPKDDLSRLAMILKTLQENELLEIADFLIQVIEYIQHPDHNNAEMKGNNTLNDIATKCLHIDKFSPLLSKLQETKLCHLRSLCMLIVDKFLEKDNLFGHVKVQFDIPFNDKAVDALNAFESSVMSSAVTVEQLNEWVKSLQALIDLLSRPEHSNILQAYQNNNPSLQKAFKHDLDKLQPALSCKEALNVMDSNIKISNYGPFMRFLQKLCGKLRMKINNIKLQQQRVQGVTAYEEKVPEEVKDFQALTGSKPVQLPPDFQDIYHSKNEDKVGDNSSKLTQSPKQTQHSQGTVATVGKQEQKDVPLNSIPIQDGSVKCIYECDQLATVYCSECECSACDDCDAFAHKKSDKSDHKRVLLRGNEIAAPPDPVLCQQCDEADSKFICIQCNMNLCQTCEDKKHKPPKMRAHQRNPL